jgi:ABC-type branched-subunit amino acid transport system substrate-binding protein
MKRFSLHTAGGRVRALATGAVVAAMAGTLVVSAFGSSAGAASAATPGVTNTTITLGATEPLTGVAANYNDIAPAMAAVFAWANAHGGVNGRKIDFKYLDDQYTPSITATMTHELVLQDNIFADVGSLGTPTQLAVQPYLNSQKIPQLFILSGCNCWSSSKYPDSSGYQPPYTVDGKILGSYTAKNFAGDKIGYFTQDDEFGFDTIKGLDMEIKSSAVVSRQVYTASTAAYIAGLTTQVAALQASGAKVVVLAAIPPFVGLFVTTAATLGYSPQLVIDGVAGDPSAIGAAAALPTGTAAAPAGQALLNGAITDGYGYFENQTSNPWVKTATKLLTQYDPLVAKDGITGDELVGFNLGYTVVQALQAAGRNLTRQGLLNAIASNGKNFINGGFVPYSYSSTSHFGYEGEMLYKMSTSATPITLPSGTYMGVAPLGTVYYTSPGAGPVKVWHGAVDKVPAKLASTA